MSKYGDIINTQVALRKLFWELHPNLDRRRITNYSGNGTMHRTDTRCVFVDWVDAMSKDGQITERLARTATLV
jgi:hypothetical protein